MTHAFAAARILSSIASVWAFIEFRATTRRENERAAVREWLFTAIRGAR